ncbi:hypothetical protein AUEXF2481DRAFT_3257 [Aureobasidium subglaciale EXF-2481]|uniref:Uncharacterized protein n=1 Tax=Aureobasidium subglaciale (strain EXF-2481) TaxID=1043005 RepID=A0A074YIA9_AURSE|nr:uncharacterized protein AUEXF2481DRAFT_3257 [Aureobasidium subglaciale EXF-2481]KAI5197833.1 hypothetical protein E4T38_07809 [Aureobasidium subglaciale]KAI5216656.1 hypothetical protein E4T40_07819 [Aureobasidium subglaciale]KAI5219993.1 hypothetical protein E4T41_07734 [Aureobasidium subglaciale]KAI5257775.1 hypothetical protein E4T46_07710 [Aureobasidium subglaciale]KEQ97445.1 hypothetical protein AUEXF2481DRAFT_3257 [Aureobasidium subglaciale EXF-2481]
MFSSLSHKRRHEDDEDAVSMHHEKRLRHSVGQDYHVFGPTSTIESQSMPGAADDSMLSTTIGNESSADMDMDMRDDFQMECSQSPELPAPWILENTPLRNPRMALDERGSRVPTPIALLTTRPKPTPLQGDTSASNAYVASTMRARLPGSRERFPSPISEDEPHTPTTATGSQFSLLTVSDIDMDAESTPRAAPQTPEVRVRKQRQRSGAFTSPRDQDTSKKFSMGYRDDCEKCRNRVPGHMNHFLR